MWEHFPGYSAFLAWRCRFLLYMWWKYSWIITQSFVCLWNSSEVSSCPLFHFKTSTLNFSKTRTLLSQQQNAYLAHIRSWLNRTHLYVPSSPGMKFFGALSVGLLTHYRGFRENINILFNTKVTICKQFACVNPSLSCIFWFDSASLPLRITSTSKFVLKSPPCLTYRNIDVRFYSVPYNDVRMLWTRTFAKSGKNQVGHCMARSLRHSRLFLSE